MTYTDTTELRVQTRLIGFDSEMQWSANKSDSVSYTNLPGGEYIFEMTVLSPDDGVLATCSLPIKKEKKLTEQTLFWVLFTSGIVMLSAATVLFYTRNKLKRIQKRQQEYKSIIEQENIYYIALLHDIGKIGIPDQILNKPGKLNAEELETIRKHVIIGGEILEDFTALEGITEGAKYHHERWDGKGYGEGLAQMDIPKVARIIGVADSYDAMSSNRCYRKALEEEVIKSELQECSGSQFDPEVVPHMLAMIEEGLVPKKEE